MSSLTPVRLVLARIARGFGWPRFLAMTVAMVSQGCAGSAGSGTGVADDSGPVDLGTNGLPDGPQPSPRPDGATLLFSAYGSDSPQASAQNAAFSPDGSGVVFTLFATGYNDGPAELWIVNTDGSDPHRVTPVEDQDNVNVPGAAWSAVRNEIVFASDREEADDIWAIGPDGSGLRRVTTHVAPPYWIEPVWSPDGEWIVFEADTEADTEMDQRSTIFRVRADGTELTQVTKRHGEDYDDRLPNWSPEGGLILFQRRFPDDEDTDGDNWDIYVVDIDGDDPVNVSQAAEYFNTDNSWSTDGEWIVSSSEYPVEGERLALPNIVAFFVPDRDSTGQMDPPVRITVSEDHEDGAPSVSPDGQWVAFESHHTDEEDSPADIWIIGTP